MSDSRPEETPPDQNLPAIQSLAPLSPATKRVLLETGGVTVRQLLTGDRCPSGRYLYDRASMSALRQIQSRLREVFGQSMHDDHSQGFV